VIVKKLSARTATELDFRIGQLIRQRRLALNMRQEDLAKELNIAPHQLQKYETAENRIAASRLLDCARVLRVPAAWFYQAASADVPDTGKQLSLSDEEQRLLHAYRLLTPEAQKQVAALAEMLPNSGESQIPGTRTKRTRK
jgi:transcriptional regulator with XRE-family HTH domain